MRPAPTLLLAGLLVLAGARQAHALWVEIRLTPKSLDHHRTTFRIATKDTGGQKQFEVTVAPKEGKLSPAIRARLELSDGQVTATIPVAGQREDGKLRFWFRVPPKYVAHSRFEVSDHGVRHRQRRPRRSPPG